MVAGGEKEEQQKIIFSKARFIIYLKIPSSGENKVELYQKWIFLMERWQKWRTIAMKKSIFVFKQKP